MGRLRAGGRQRARRLARDASVSLLIGTLVSGALCIVGAQPAAAAALRCVGAPPISAAGSNSAYALRSDGTLAAWGDNFFGQLGDGTHADRLAPTSIPSAGKLTALSSGSAHVVALKPDGTVFAWGANSVGQLGDGTLAGSAAPRVVPGLSEVVAVEAGAYSSYAIRRDGTVWAWGRNDKGQLGDGTFVNRLVPKQIPTLTGASTLSADGGFAAALIGTTVHTWGENGHGQLGRGSTSVTYPSPGPVGGLPAIAGIAVSESVAFGHTLAVSTAGSVYAWGDGTEGQLGNGAFASSVAPVLVSGVSAVTDVSAGGSFSLARKSDGSVWAWGANTVFQLGNNAPTTDTYQPTPVQVLGLSNAVAIDAGSVHSIAVTSGGAVRTWGANTSGGIGDSTTVTRPTPFTTSVTQSLPAAPTELDAVEGEELAYLRWTQPTSLVTQYVVTPFLGGIAQPPVVTNYPIGDFAVRDLLEGSTYSFTVAAQNCLGPGPATARSQRVVPTSVQFDRASFKVETMRVSERISTSVNTFNGNLGVHGRDLALRGTGVDFELSRTWNSRSTSTSIFGNRWSASVGDVRLQTFADGSVFYRTASGGVVPFAIADDGSFEAAAGASGDLTRSDNGTPANSADDFYLLRDRVTRERQIFAATTGKLTRREDRNGNAMSYAYGGPGGAISTITDTHGRTITFSYNPQGLVATVSAAGLVWRYFYDPGKNLERVQDPELGDTIYGYDAGDLITVTTPAGRLVRFGFDGIDRVRTIRWALAPGTPTTTYSYNADNTVVTDANGKSTTYRADPAGRTTAVVDALGNTAELAYTSRSNVKTIRSPGAATEFEYTDAHAVESITAPTGASVRAGYEDPAHPSLPTEIRDSQGNTLHYDYDAAGNLRAQTAQLGADAEDVVLTYGSGRLSSVRDMNDRLTTYGYDAVGRVTSITPPAPLGAIGPITYDGASRVKTLRDGNRLLTTFDYDGLDHIERVTYDDGSLVERTYDPDGNLKTETDTAGTTTWNYNERGLLERRTTADGFVVTYGYDNVGNLTRISDASGATRYRYNDVNLVDLITTPDGLMTELTYDERYNLRVTYHPNGMVVTQDYDLSNRVAGVKAVSAGTTIVNLVYSYANPETGNTDAGLRFKLTDRVARERTVYDYDELNRLISATRSTFDGAPIDAYTYAYDAAGNRLSARHDVAADALDAFDTFSYNPANQLRTHNAETIDYDGNGNMVGSSLGAQFTYNAANQTTSAIPTAGRGTPAQYLYNGPGQAARRAIGPVATHLETPPLCALSCVDPADADIAAATFTADVLGISSRTDAAVRSTHFTRDLDGRVLSQRSVTGNTYLVADGLGSTVAVTANDGRTLATYRYDPFGNLAAGTGAVEITPWRYAGGHLDPTGLYKMGERYYDPLTARFTQQDPLTNPIDPKLWNRYAYVGGDPVNFTDRDGLRGCRHEGGLWGLFDRAFSFVDDAIALGGGLGAVAYFAGVAATTLNPLTYAAAFALTIGAAVYTGVRGWQTFNSYVDYRSGIQC